MARLSLLDRLSSSLGPARAGADRQRVVGIEGVRLVVGVDRLQAPAGAYCIKDIEPELIGLDRNLSEGRH